MVVVLDLKDEVYTSSILTQKLKIVGNALLPT